MKEMPGKPLLNKESAQPLLKDGAKVYYSQAQNPASRGFSMKAGDGEVSNFMGAVYTQSGNMLMRFSVEGNTVGEPELLSFPYQGNYSVLYPTMGTWIGKSYRIMGR